jgi:predicted ArsR family transcriptional regulator
MQAQRRCTIPQLSAAFAMTRANMRYHLEKMVAEGVLEVTHSTPEGRGRGRPVQTYQLALTAHPNNLAQLADTLLRQVTSVEQLRQLAHALAAEPDLPRQVTQRINRVIQLLNLKRYQARWEAHAQAPRIILRNCPYAALLPDHPELCQLDAYLLEHLLDMPVEQLARMDVFDSRPPACIFAVRLTAKPG